MAQTPSPLSERRTSRRNSGGVQFGGMHHRFDDLDITGAAADVAAERLADLVSLGRGLRRNRPAEAMINPGVQ